MLTITTKLLTDAFIYIVYTRSYAITHYLQEGGVVILLVIPTPTFSDHIKRTLFFSYILFIMCISH